MVSSIFLTSIVSPTLRGLCKSPLNCKKRTFSALIIGIDKYADDRIDNLYGAVADAYRLKEFLLQAGMTDDRIKVICNETATHACIEKEIATLSKNSNPSLVYYAGYGATFSYSLSSTEKKTKILLPYDFDLDGGEGERGIAIEQVISSFKKREFVLVIDCCFSKQHRDHTEAEGLIRGIDLPKPRAATKSCYSKQSLSSSIVNLLERLGRAILTLGALLDDFSGSDVYAHVLLAACKDEELARESNGHGVFTRELLSALQENDITRLTYEDLIRCLPHKGYCEGRNKSQRILNTASLEPPKTYSVRPGAASGEYIMSVGEAHGINPGTEVGVFADESLTQKLGELVVSEAYICSSIAKKPLFCDNFNIVAPTYAVKHNDLNDGVRVFLDPGNDFLSHIKSHIQGSRDYRYIVLLEDRDQSPDLFVKYIHDQVHFEIINQSCRDIGFATAPLTISADKETILSLLRSITNFLWHIHRTSRQAAIGQKVEFECKKLVEVGRDSLLPTLIPEGDNLVRDDIIDVVVEGKMYGFCITNKSSMELFCALFYFDMSDLSITPYYQNSRTDPLRRGGSLTFGYGTHGGRPVRYFLREGQGLDVGFLKLFLSTEYVDYSDLSQESVFMKGFGARKQPVYDKKGRGIIWDSVLVTVIQRRSD